ncbi:MAG: hypothetical protein ACI4PJ_02230 [Acutalibacteraceae bacterium]
MKILADNKSIEEMLNKTSKKLGTNPDKLKDAVSKGNVNDLLKNLDNKQAGKVSKILSDKNKVSELLSSPKAQELIKKFFGGK